MITAHLLNVVILRWRRIISWDRRSVHCRFLGPSYSPSLFSGRSFKVIIVGISLLILGISVLHYSAGLGGGGDFYHSCSWFCPGTCGTPSSCDNGVDFSTSLLLKLFSHPAGIFSPLCQLCGWLSASGRLPCFWINSLPLSLASHLQS